jgi:hypothetical protein
MTYDHEQQQLQLAEVAVDRLERLTDAICSLQKAVVASGPDVDRIARALERIAGKIAPSEGDSRFKRFRRR